VDPVAKEEQAEEERGPDGAGTEEERGAGVEEK
jgi:hypothetical protein